MARFTITNYGVIELNHVSWPETARVFGQLPLNSIDFADTPAENGMWLAYDVAGGSVRFADAITEPVGVLYMGEKEYNQFEPGLNNYRLECGGFYPRIGMPMVGDIYTTNTFSYTDGSGTGEFDGNAAVVTALGNLASAPLYLIPSTTDGAPRLTNAAGLAAATGVATVAQVVKYYTLPNGDPAIKVQFTKVA